MVRICEATSGSAAYGTRLLAELGHDVIRLEHPMGDAIRRRGPYIGGEVNLNTGAHHQHLNAGKRSLSLSLNRGGSDEVLRRLIQASDVLVSDSPLRLDSAELLNVNPQLVLVEVVGGDQSELCLAASSGLLALTGRPGGAPSLLGGGGVVEAAAGLFVSIAVGSALLAKQRSGSGEHVRVSVPEALESLVEQAMINYVTEGEVAERVGHRGAATALSGVFRAGDGYFALSVPPVREVWLDFVQWLDDPELSALGELADEAERVERADLILGRLEAWSAGQSRDPLVEVGQAHRMPATPVTSMSELADSAQLRHRGFLKVQEHPIFGKTSMHTGALATATGRQDSLRAPRLGEHNSEVLTELRYTPTEQVALIEEGVI